MRLEIDEYLNKVALDCSTKDCIANIKQLALLSSNMDVSGNSCAIAPHDRKLQLVVKKTINVWLLAVRLRLSVSNCLLLPIFSNYENAVSGALHHRTVSVPSEEFLLQEFLNVFREIRSDLRYR